MHDVLQRWREAGAHAPPSARGRGATARALEPTPHARIFVRRFLRPGARTGSCGGVRELPGRDGALRVGTVGARVGW